MPEQAGAARPAAGADIEYGPFYFRHDCGIPYERNDHWLEFFDRIADSIVRDLRPTSVLDAGCAMGFLVEALRRRGVEAWGVDVSEYAISQVDDSVAEYCSVGSIAEPLARQYDLIVTIEVLEHLPPDQTEAAIANLCAATDRLLFSSTPDDFGEATHLNVRPTEDWSASLAANDFFRDVERDASFVTPWAGVYSRRQEPLVDTVRRYDRAWARLQQETAQIRQSLLTATGRIEELERLNSDALPSTSDLDEARAEILRLRDLLIGKELELGVARGKLQVHDDRARRMAAVAMQIEAKIPIFGRLAGPLLRLFRVAGDSNQP